MCNLVFVLCRVLLFLHFFFSHSVLFIVFFVVFPKVTLVVLAFILDLFRLSLKSLNKSRIDLG